MDNIQFLYEYNINIINKFCDKYFVDDVAVKMFFMYFLKDEWLDYFIKENPNLFINKTLIICIDLQKKTFVRFNNINGDIFCEFIEEYIEEVPDIIYEDYPDMKNKRIKYKILQKYGKCGNFVNNVFDIRILGKPLDYFNALSLD